MKPIIFNTEMVKAILDGRKNTFRLPIKKEKICEDWIMQRQSFKDTVSKYKVDDILYVKETFQFGDNIRNIQNIPLNKDTEVLYYEDEINSHNSNNKDFAKIIKWKPSIHLKQKDARIFLKVTNVRVERLQDISEDNLEKEGIVSYSEKWENMECECTKNNRCQRYCDRRLDFINLWNSTLNFHNGIRKSQNILNKYNWEDNPYVFVYEFERIEK